MNKVFKKVFNAARGMMMVVNETTSSVQTGKKAAVTVAVLGALAGTSASAATDPMIDLTAGTVYGATSASDVSSELILTGGKTYPGKSTLYAGGKDTTALTSSSFKVTGENGKSTFDSLSMYGGSRFSSGKSATAVEKAEISLKDVEFSSSGTTYIYGGAYIAEGGNTTVGIEETKVHLTNVTGNIRVFGGGRTYYTRNSNQNVGSTSIIIDTADGGSTTVSRIIGGGLISGNESQNNSWSRVGNVDISLGKGVKVTEMIIGGNWINWFGNAEVEGDVSITLDGTDAADAAVYGGNYIDYAFSGALTGGVESSTAERQALMKEGATTTIVVKNGATVGLVVGGGYVNRWYENNPDMQFTSQASNVVIDIADSTVKGSVVGGGRIFDQAGASRVDVTESVTVKVTNSNVEGVITTDSINTTDDDTIIPTSAPAEKVAMSLTNVKAGAVAASKGTVELRAEGNGTTEIGQLSTDGAKVALTAISRRPL